MDRYVMEYADTPPSQNKTGTRGSWKTYHGHKQRWQKIFSDLLMFAQIPRRTYQYIEASAVLTAVSRRRDSDNWPIISKSLGDAIVRMAILDDDTPDHYRFSGVTFENGPKKTTITLMCKRAEEPES